MSDKCTCPELHLGIGSTGSKNWSHSCPDHGLESEWFKSDEQVKRRDAQLEKLREIQRQAYEARLRYDSRKQWGV